jgi:hypothetical protein
MECNTNEKENISLGAIKTWGRCGVEVQNGSSSSQDCYLPAKFYLNVFFPF